MVEPTGLVADVRLELVDLLRELLLLVLKLPDLRPDLAGTEVVAPDLVHPLVRRLELRLPRRHQGRGWRQ